MNVSEREVLPTGLKPINYDLSIYDIDFETAHGEGLGNNRACLFRGTVLITYQVLSTVEEIQLNARDLKILGAVATFSNGKTENSVSASSIVYDEKLERVCLKLNQEINAASTTQIVVEIQYEGYVHTDMNSFYLSRYTTPEGKKSVMFSTQFESTAARMAFPCADEPNLKATFDFRITLPNEWTALSNMPVKSSKVVGDGKKKTGSENGLKTVHFEKTPIMSTYLLAWAIGDFEYIEALSKKTYGPSQRKIPVRVYTTKGLAEKLGQSGLKAATKTVDFYSELFDIEYPLPKIDLIAVHELAGNAMENFGLITFRPTAILFESQGDIMAESKVSYVVAHEMAHQWFGNLVTMDWWDGLWLNEGFATYCGWLAVDKMHPEWDVFSRFVSEALQMALTLDSLRSSHPVEVQVRAGADIDQIFDHISYLKGASIIRMLSATLGVETFIKGVSLYLKTHAFSNATTVDLWKALSTVSGVDVQSAMGNWTSKIGYPLLTVDQSGDSVSIRQDRFLTSGDVQPEENQTIWWTPLNILRSDESVDSSVLNSRKLDISEIVKGSNFFKLNRDQIGAFRVNYSEKQLTSLSEHAASLSNKDKVGLLADARATAFAGVGSTSGLLTLITAFGNETDYYVWSEMMSALGSIRSVWSEQDSQIRAALSKFTEGLVLPVLSKLGWDALSSDSNSTIQLRALLAAVAAGIGSPVAIEESEKRFEKYLAGDKKAIHPSMRAAVFSAVLRFSTGSILDRAYTYLENELQKPSSVDASEVAAVAIGKVRDPALIKRSLKHILDGVVAVQDVHFMTDQLSFNPDARNETWNFIKENWNAIHSKYSSNAMIFDRLIRLTLVNYVSEEKYNDIASFFKDKSQEGFDRSLAQALDTIKSKSQWVKKDNTVVVSWLAAHNYLTK